MNVYKNLAGAYLLRGLFFETTLADKTGVLFTLKDEDHNGYPSLKKLYMSYEDPTEYQFAINHLAGVEHWEKLCECNWFKPYVAQWRREAELRLKSQALARMLEDSKTAGKNAYSANKFILEKGWEPKEGQTKRGRPSKAEIKQEAEAIYDQFTEDAKRLGIN